MIIDNRYKVFIIIGTRPEAIKMCPLIFELRKKEAFFKTVVITTGQHKEMLAQILSEFAITPDHNLDVMVKDQSLAGLTGKILSTLDKLLALEKPDIMLVQGDTTTSFVASLAAFYHKTMVGHVEAGLRTYKKYYPFPEEINRKLISVITDIHFPPTQLSANNLLNEGIPSENIHITGNTVIDTLLYVTKQMVHSWCGFQNINHKQILITTHRRENFGQPLKNICSSVKQLINKYPDIEFTIPVHKNPNVRTEIFEELSKTERVNLIEPVDYFDFVSLMNASHLILTDSGGIQEEAPSLGKPVFVLRNETERPEGIDAGTVKLIGTDLNTIVTQVSNILDNKVVYSQMANATNPYGDGTASQKIISIIYSMLNNKNETYKQ